MNRLPVQMVDANEAVSSVAYRLSEVIAIYPITPASPMGEFADQWATQKRKNLWGKVPDVVEMQSEGGAIAAVHGALQSGALSTTFTASQGLLLMLPNMYKIAGELTPFTMHVAARTIATHALSIFGDHSDVMGCRQTGFGLLCSNQAQEAHDMAAIAHASSLRTRIPFLHFFDGFRTSHEISNVAFLSDDELHRLIRKEDIQAFRERALTPDHPSLRGTAQNPDVFFQAREASNLYYDRCPAIVQEVMDEFKSLTGRAYHLYEYEGDPHAEEVLILMGSGCETAAATVHAMNKNGAKRGVLKVRLYRPLDLSRLIESIPPSVRRIAVLDRTKEPGALGDPLYMDVVLALREAGRGGDVQCIAGRYGLSSKEFHPGMVKAVFDELGKEKPKNHFTVGIHDDVSHRSISFDSNYDIESKETFRAIFYGLGSDGTVGANKNSIKIIGEQTGKSAQGYFVYDSKKSGAMTISHLRFGPEQIRAPYLIRKANFIACHHMQFLEKLNVLECADDHAVFLLNSPYGKSEVWNQIPAEIQKLILEKSMKVYAIDAHKVAKEVGLGGRTNTILQTCFFAISGVLPRDEAIQQIKVAIEKTYAKRGQEVVLRNFEAVDRALENLHFIETPGEVTSSKTMTPVVSPAADDFVQRVTAVMMRNQGDLLPVSAFPVDGSWPTGTAKWEKRSIAMEIPVWDTDLCIQCNKCALVCPHAAIRAKYYSAEDLSDAPSTFKSAEFRSKEVLNQKYTIQVAPDDCTGCSVCVEVCPARDKSNSSRKAIQMKPLLPIRDDERENYSFFLDLPNPDRSKFKSDVKGSQFLEPLFEYSGACAGCGETPYIKLLTQLYGDRLMIANATGCSSIYGGNLPTTPYTMNESGRGPAWANSLFEDNAEFGLGYRLAVDALRDQCTHLLETLRTEIGGDFVEKILHQDQSEESGIVQQRENIEALRKRLAEIPKREAQELLRLADYLVEKSVWIVGGDGWAYDIGYGGLDHVLALNRNVNILVLDTEVYSNTGGQASKATPLGASAKFAMAGKALGKKDLGMMAMSYGNVYVARIAFGARDLQTVKAFQEAASYPGPSLIIAYSHCIAHGYDMAHGPDQQRKAVESGIWPIYRFDPRRIREKLPPLQLDSPNRKLPVHDYFMNEARFRITEKMDPRRFKNLMKEAEIQADRRFQLYEQLSHLMLSRAEEGGAS